MDEVLDNKLGGDLESDVETNVEPNKYSSIELYWSRLAAAVSSANSRKLLGKFACQESDGRMNHRLAW